MEAVTQQQDAQQFTDALLGGYIEERLQHAFSRVASKADWRAPILGFVHRRDLDVTKYAVQFYTSTELVETGAVSAFIPGSEHELDLLEVKAIGYRAGPAGDH
ncbi:MAG TPA: hypothetical protein VMW24_15925 [Sedimentisphaerales bacterium]|nr:hypothetical protein [Sedimentisphaerales bacterium]